MIIDNVEIKVGAEVGIFRSGWRSLLAEAEAEYDYYNQFGWEDKMEQIHIKQQTVTGNWNTVRIVDNISEQYIYQNMLTVKRSFPSCRIKATTADGRMVDLMEWTNV